MSLRQLSRVSVGLENVATQSMWLLVAACTCHLQPLTWLRLLPPAQVAHTDVCTLWCLQKGCSGNCPRAPSSANHSVPELDLTVSDGSSKRGEVASSTFSGACCKPLGS